MQDDAQLLRQFVKERSQTAFAELVRKHIDLVYSAGCRIVRGDVHRAEDICQEVFTTLARKAPLLTDHPVLVGWLHTTTRHAALRLVRAETRRNVREQKAFIMQEANSSDAAEVNWDEVGPFLDDALAKLNDRDREAVLLRYFEGRPFGEIGRCLGISEDAARMRVERALEKLRVGLSRRGLASSSAALGLVLTQQGVTAAPAGFAATVVTTAFGAAASGATGVAALAIFMSTTKFTVAVGVASALVLGTAVYQDHVAARALSDMTDAHARLSTVRHQHAALTRRLPEAPAAVAQAGTAGTRGVAAAKTVHPAVEDDTDRLIRTDAEVREVYLRRSRADMALRYTPLFERLKLSPEQRSLFLDGAVSYLRQRLVQPGGSRNIDPLADPQVSGLLRTQFGEHAARAFRDFERSAGARNLASEFVGRSYYTDEPWTREQVEQMTDLIAEASASYRAGRAWEDVEVDWDAVLERAKPILTPKQFAAVRSIGGMVKMGQMMHVAEIEATATSHAP